MSCKERLEKVNDILVSESISASLYISDRCHWEGAAGVTAHDTKIPANPEMIYSFGSITKTFVASIILQLVEENKLNLEDPLGKWLSQYPNIDENITIRQLLNHGSGLYNFTDNEQFWSDMEAVPERAWLPKGVLKYVGPPPELGLDSPSYSNTNYILLGMIIKAVSGNSFEHELQNRITRPLQLTSSYLPKKDYDPGRWANSTILFNSLYSSIQAAGAIASTSSDIAKFSHLLYSGKFLHADPLKSMQESEFRRIGRDGLPMGLGVMKLWVGGKAAWGHGGELYKFKSQAYYVPELNLSVAYSYVASDYEDWRPIPGGYLLRAFIDHRPDDISMCFDS